MITARPRSRTALATALAATVALTLGACSPEAGEDPALLTGRMWLEKKPDKPTDHVHGAMFLPRPSLGLFQRSSAYDFHFERFDYKRDGAKVELTFPQTGKQAELTYTIKACDSLPPFDLCLELSENPWGGPRRYYGKRRWSEGEQSAARALLSQPE